MSGDGKCKNCGGGNFSLESGFYYCVECQTQSEDMIELIYEDYFLGQKATTRVLKTKSVEKLAKEAEFTPTSWEIFNYILKGMVDSLMKLGATRKVKIITFQLWSSYLHQLEVAFMSTGVPCKPRIDINFRPNDAEIVYGVTSKKMKQSDKLLKLRSKSRKALASSCSSNETLSDTDTGVSDANISRRSYLRKLFGKKYVFNQHYQRCYNSSNRHHNRLLSTMGTKPRTQHNQEVQVATVNIC